MIKTILKSIFILALISLLIFVYSKEFYKFYSLHHENERIKSRMEELKLENQELKKNISVLKNDISYIEKMAREELGMIKESEKIYKFQE